MKLLLKIGFQADAAAVNMWRAAQSYWRDGRALMPEHVFSSLEFASDLLGACLAEARGDMVYVRGSSTYLDWTAEKREAAKAGGKKSAQRPRNAKGQLQKLPKQSPSKNQAEPKLSQASGSGSGSGSLSPSGSESEELSSSGKMSSVKKQEARFRFVKEIEKIKPYLAPFFMGVTPTDAIRLIPDLIIACEGNADQVISSLEDLYQSPRIRNGDGVEGSRASYNFMAIKRHFGIESAS